MEHTSADSGHESTTTAGAASPATASRTAPPPRLSKASGGEGEGLEGEASPPAKRAALAPSAAQSAESSTAAATDTGTEADAKRQLLVEKLLRVQADDKKVGKATAILARALQTELSAATAPAFLPLLEAMQARRVPARAGEEIAAGYAAVFSVVRDRLEAIPPERRFAASTWVLRGVVHRDLMTDDSFRFARACKRLQAALEEMDIIFRTSAQQEADGTPIADTTRRLAATDADKADRCACVVELLATLLTMHGRLWARPSVEHTFRLATDRRALFDASSRERLDELTNALRERKSAGVLGAKKTANRTYAFESIRK